MVTLRAALAVLVFWIASGIPAMAQDVLPPEKARVELVLDEPDGVPFEKQMVLATIRSVFFVNLTLEEMTVPRMRDVEWVQLSPDYWAEERIDGRTARVMTRRMALFPQRPGETTIRAVTHEVQITGAGGARTRHVVKSEPVTLQVRPGLAAAGDWWMPVLALEVTDEWNKDAGSLEDGDSAQRSVTVQALGATPQMLPPQPPMREPWLITFKPPEVREMALTPLGPMTTVQWTWNLRPKTGEPGVLPEVRIPWYDTAGDAPQIAILDAAPFGYESFGDNAAINWRSGFQGIWVLVAGGAAGALLTLLAMIPGARIRSRSEIAAAIRRRLPDPDRRALRRAARRGDRRGFRMAAAALLRRRRLGERETLDVLAPVDAGLFADGDPESGTDLTAVARTVLGRRGDQVRGRPN